MKKYFKNYRRGANAAFFIVLGCVFIGLGVLAIFFMGTGWAIACFVFGALLATLPLFVVFSRYGMKGNELCYAKAGLPHKKEAKDIAAAVICIYDEYRRWKGFVPATFQTKNGSAAVPAIVFLSGIDEDELDLCDTRMNTKIAFRGKVIADMSLDFDFLEQFWQSDFGGKVYVSEYMYALYRPAFDQIFDGDERVCVYDRIPKKMKNYMK